MKYYVVSDVHSYFSILMQTLKDKGFFDEKEPCKLILCGDLLDRGDEARVLIEYMLHLMDEGKLIYVLGNHEELLVQCLHEISCGGVHKIASGMSHHYSNGTWDTLLQISEMTEKEAYNYPDELVRRVMNSKLYKKLLTCCVDYYETPNYVFVHGWIPCFMEGDRANAKYRYNPDWRNADVRDWQRARWLNGMEVACKHRVIEPGKTVVCGHWNTSYGHAHINHTSDEWGAGADFSPFKANGILAIDASTANSSKMNCIVIED